MFAVLGSFNGQQVPEWRFSINLSTIVAMLATIFRATIVTILGKVISQAKWAWFSGPQARPLQHFQDFDDGSRGIVGAGVLIPKVLKNNVVATLAALVIIASFAVGSFVQQAIKTKDCEHPLDSGVASIPYVHYVPRQTINYESTAICFFGHDLKLAVYRSLTTPEGTENQIDPVCTTGNCTYPTGDPAGGSASNDSDGYSVTFSTVGLCRSCIDVSSHVRYNGTTDGSTQYILPNGQEIDYNGKFGNILTVSTSNLTWAEASSYELGGARGYNLYDEWGL
jgi:hypothetical protein